MGVTSSSAKHMYYFTLRRSQVNMATYMTVGRNAPQRADDVKMSGCGSDSEMACDALVIAWVPITQANYRMGGPHPPFGCRRRPLPVRSLARLVNERLCGPQVLPRT